MGMNIEHGTGISQPLEKWGYVHGIFRDALTLLHRKGYAQGDLLNFYLTFNKKGHHHVKEGCGTPEIERRKGRREKMMLLALIAAAVVVY